MKKDVEVYDKLLSGDMLFEKSITAMMIVDDTRTIVKANTQFYKLFGYRQEEVIGFQTSILTPSLEHFYQYKKYFQQTMDGSYESSELLYKKKDDTLFWVKLKGIPITVNDQDFIIWSFDDITKDVNAREEIKNKNLELQIIFDRVNKGLVFVTDNIIERANRAFAEMMNDRLENIVGKNVKKIFECFDTCRKTRDRKTIKLQNAEEYSIFVEREIIEIAENTYIIVLSDVTDHVCEKETLTKMAQTDGLTGIYNKTTFADLAQDMILSLDYDDISFIMLDIDHFKNINDTFGHDIGDEVLVELTCLIKNHLRANEIFGRLGGEEFGIIFPMKKEKAVAICERLMNLIRTNTFTSIDLELTVSMGIVDNNVSNMFDTIYKEADKLLYKAKKSGRDRICT